MKAYSRTFTEVRLKTKELQLKKQIFEKCNQEQRKVNIRKAVMKRPRDPVTMACYGEGSGNQAR